MLCCAITLAQALVQYPDETIAQQAKEYLDGHCMYPNSRNKVRWRRRQGGREGKSTTLRLLWGWGVLFGGVFIPTR